MKIKEKDEAKAATSNLWKPHDCSWKGSEPLLLTYASHRIVWKAGQFCYLHWQTECKNIHLHVFHKRYLLGINMQKNWKWKNIKDRPHKYYTEESRNSSGTQDFKLKIQLECSDMVNIQYPASIQEVRALGLGPGGGWCSMSQLRRKQKNSQSFLCHCPGECEGTGKTLVLMTIQRRI